MKLQLFLKKTEQKAHKRLHRKLNVHGVFFFRVPFQAG